MLSLKLSWELRLAATEQADKMALFPLTASPNPVPFPLHFLFEKRFTAQRLATFKRMVFTPMLQIAFVGIVASDFPQAHPAFVHDFKRAHG
jgi:hypothetical protein